MAVVIDKVVTGDATPAVAPNRISKQPSKDTAAITLHLDDIAHLYPSATLHPQSPSPRPGATLYPGATLDPQDGPIPERHAYVRGYRVVAGGASPFSGTYLTGRGLPCGPDTLCGPDSYCDNFLALSFDVLNDVLTSAELGAQADGDVTINVYGHAGTGWA